MLFCLNVTLSDIVDSNSESILGQVQGMTREQQIQAIFGGQNTNGYDLLFDVNEGNFISIGGNDTANNNQPFTSQMLNLAAGFPTGHTTNLGNGQTQTAYTTEQNRR